MSPPPNRRILLIDDTPSIHEDFRRILSGTGATSEIDAAEEALFGEVNGSADVACFDVDSAHQGREGLERVRESLEANRPYALAFVDMRMPPGWDGVETIREIWNVDPRLQIVICTAHSDYSWDEVLGHLGVEDRLLILKKPFDNIEVAQLASALTAKWQMTRQAELKVSRLEAAVQDRTRELGIANKELEALVHKVTKLAMHDALTGLPNRLLFADRATQMLASRPRDHSCPVVLMLDLDRFKEVNDTLGHHTGDRLLEIAATRLARAVRPEDTVARLGGDEFAVLLTAINDSAAALEAAARIRLVLAEPYHLDGMTLQVETSIGVALHPEHSDTVPRLLQLADVAMYQAKEERTGIELYRPECDIHTPDRLDLLGSVRRAIENGELEMHFQPSVSFPHGRPVGVEALVRWKHPGRGLLYPDAFLDLVEQAGMMRQLTHIALAKSLAQAAQWWSAGIELPVAVNVSVRDLSDTGFGDVVADLLRDHQLPARALKLEITEHVLMADPARMTHALESMGRLGVDLSLDDFGTGYSSLVHLKRLPVSEIKVDRSFVQRMTTDADDAAIVRSIVDLAHSLGLRVVAEGVETVETWRALEALGCDIAQGYLISRPVPGDEVTRWLAGHFWADETDPAEPIAAMARP